MNHTARRPPGRWGEAGWWHKDGGVGMSGSGGHFAKRSFSWFVFQKPAPRGSLARHDPDHGGPAQCSRTTRSQRCSLYSTSMRKSLTTNTWPQVPIAMVALLNKRGAPAPCRLPCVVQSAPTQFFERLEGPTGRRGRFLCSRGWSSTSLVVLFIWQTQLDEICRLAP